MSRSTTVRPRGARKRYFGATSLAAVAVIGLVALSGCAPAADTGGDDSPIVIGVAMKTQLQERWAFDVAAMQAEADAQGAELIVQYANDDATLQASQVENLLSQSIDALIIVPVDDTAAASSAAAAKREGIPVISYDIGVQGVVVDAFVIRNNGEVGQLQAEGALEFTGGAGNYALIGGDAANDVAQAINANHVSTLEGTDVNIVFDEFTKNWDPATALASAENILSTNNDDVAAFLTANDGMAGGVIQALQGRGLGGQVFVSGLDATPSALKLILQGLQTMSVWTPIDQQGKIAVETALALARGEAIMPDETVDNGSGTPIPAMLVPVQAITIDNVCDFINTIAPEGWVSVEDVYDDPAECPAA